MGTPPGLYLDAVPQRSPPRASIHHGCGEVCVALAIARDRVPVLESEDLRYRGGVDEIGAPYGRHTRSLHL
jgi:hypothetical protein